MKYTDIYGTPLKEFLGKQKIIPGWRYFHCGDCNHTWREKCRDIESNSQECCEKCHNPCDPVGWAYHPEWPRDKSGNLIDESDRDVP